MTDKRIDNDAVMVIEVNGIGLLKRLECLFTGVLHVESDDSDFKGMQVNLNSPKFKVSIEEFDLEENMAHDLDSNDMCIGFGGTLYLRNGFTQERYVESVAAYAARPMLPEHDVHATLKNEVKRMLEKAVKEHGPIHADLGTIGGRVSISQNTCPIRHRKKSHHFPYEKLTMFGTLKRYVQQHPTLDASAMEHILWRRAKEHKVRITRKALHARIGSCIRFIKWEKKHGKRR